MMFTYIDVQSGYHEKQIKPLLMEVNAVSKYESYTAKFLKDGGDYLNENLYRFKESFGALPCLNARYEK